MINVVHQASYSIKTHPGFQVNYAKRIIFCFLRNSNWTKCVEVLSVPSYVTGQLPMPSEILLADRSIVYILYKSSSQSLKK